MVKRAIVVLSLVGAGVLGYLLVKNIHGKTINPPHGKVIGVIRSDGQLWYSIILDDGQWHHILDWNVLGMTGPPDPNTIQKYNLSDLTNSKIYQGSSLTC